MRTRTSFKSSFLLKVNIFHRVGHIWFILSVAFIMSFSLSLYFLMEFSQYLKIPFLWDPFKQNSELPKQMCERTCSYSERHLLLILWLIGNHKTKVWPSIIHITFLKDEDNLVHPEIHTLPFLMCAPMYKESPFAAPSSIRVLKYKLLCSKCICIYIYIIYLSICISASILSSIL